MKGMIRRMGEKTTKLMEFLNFAGGVSGVIALGTIIFYGGALVEKVKGIDARVSVVEASGSVSLRQHIAADDQLHNSDGARLKMVENSTISSAEALHKIDMKLESACVKLDGLKDQLARHEEGKER